jgi:indole-3-glycerol phosphate synthase
VVQFGFIDAMRGKGRNTVIGEIKAFSPAKGDLSAEGILWIF